MIRDWFDRVGWYPPVALALFLCIVVSSAMVRPSHAQYFMELAPGGVESPVNPTVVIRDREVSAVATAQTITYDSRGIVNVLAIVMSCSAGTAAVTVSGSSDGVNFLTIDTIVAAASIIKNYNNSTVGATTAVSPLAFRFIRISVATCGASNTSTLTVAGK